MKEELPTPPQIAECPELAILAVVDLALDVCERTLLAAHPELDQPEQPYLASSTAQYALRLLGGIWRLKRDLSCYSLRAREDSTSGRDVDDADIRW